MYVCSLYIYIYSDGIAESHSIRNELRKRLAIYIYIIANRGEQSGAEENKRSVERVSVGAALPLVRGEKRENFVIEPRRQWQRCNNGYVTRTCYVAQDSYHSSGYIYCILCCTYTSSMCRTLGAFYRNIYKKGKSNHVEWKELTIREKAIGNRRSSASVAYQQRAERTKRERSRVLGLCPTPPLPNCQPSPSSFSPSLFLFFCMCVVWSP